MSAYCSVEVRDSTTAANANLCEIVLVKEVRPMTATT